MTENSTVVSVQHLKTICFSLLPLEEKLKIKNSDRPKPNLSISNITKCKTREYKRTFRVETYDKNEWLCGCDVTNILYCFPCLMFAGNDSTEWTKVGVKDLIHLTEKIKKHQSLKAHLSAKLGFNLLGKQDIRQQLNSAYRNVSVTVSILTLAFISIDRWYAICFPLKFKSTTGRAKTAIGAIWIIALVCEIPEPIFLIARPFSKKYTYFTQCIPTWGNKTDTVFMIVKMVLFYWSPLVLMSIAYIQIIRVLWRSGNAPHQSMRAETGSCRSGQSVNFAMNMNASTEGQLRSRRKAAKMLVAVVAMFAFCFLPVHLLSILRLTVNLSNSEPNRALSLISHWLCYANSAVNPIIYNFMSGKFRQEFKSAFFKCSQVNRSDLNFTRTSTYIYRYTTNTRHSGRSKTEMIPLSTIK